MRTLPPLLTPREVAEILRVNTRTLDRWAASGRLQPIRLTTSTVRYRADDIADLIDRAHADAGNCVGGIPDEVQRQTRAAGSGGGADAHLENLINDHERPAKAPVGKAADGDGHDEG